MRLNPKVSGYIIRLAAVIIWGIQPLLIKYTVINDIAPIHRIPLFAVGITVGLLLIYIPLWLFKKSRGKSNNKLRVNKYFIIIIVSEILMIYLMNTSLLYTHSTNLILINNFAPVFALLLAVLLWSSQIPYLRERKNIALIFVIFLVGCAGSSLILYNDIKQASANSLFGDALAFLMMAVDVVLVVSQIRYVKVVKSVDTIRFTLIVFSMVTLLTFPIVFLRFNTFLKFPVEYFIFALLIGILIGAGKILNYEAFKRIDGFIAFLMFNISIFITFIGEAFVLSKILPTFLLIMGGSLIMGASIAAEFINTKSERKMQ